MNSSVISEALKRISSVVQSNINHGEVTDIYRTASELHEEFSTLHLDELIALIEIVVVSLDGAAFWFDESTGYSRVSSCHR